MAMLRYTIRGEAEDHLDSDKAALPADLKITFRSHSSVASAFLKAPPFLALPYLVLSSVSYPIRRNILYSIP